jgi:hypothetical protein
LIGEFEIKVKETKLIGCIGWTEDKGMAHIDSFFILFYKDSLQWISGECLEISMNTSNTHFAGSRETRVFCGLDGRIDVIVGGCCYG